mmetsp:Transcript_11190/g.29148  ORF Transcript_11190/g.29148 Transcript_11190/m.29148 type:complete len:182 (+) Transcript_11190:51-596(+)
MGGAENAVGWSCTGVGCILLAIGVIQLLIIGTQGLDPDADFRELGSVCQILDVHYDVDVIGSNYGKGSACIDVYTYTFTSREDDVRDPPARLTSGQERHRRSCNVRRTPSDYVAGATVQCWEPAHALRVRARSREYNCGNPECIKVENPANYGGRKVSFIQVFIGLPMLLIGLGVLAASAC